MLNGTNSSDEYEDTDAMARHETELETEERCGQWKFRGCRQRQPEEHRSYHDAMPSDCYCNRMRRLEIQEFERKPRRRTKSQVRRYIPCDHPHETPTWKQSMEKNSYPNNMNDTLNKWEHYISNLTTQPLKKSQDSYSYNPHPRKRQTSVHRRPRRGEHDQMILSSMRNNVDSDMNPRPCCEYEQPVKMMHNRDMEEIVEQSDDHANNCQVIRILKDLDASKHLLENYMKKERGARSEAWMSKQYVERTSKLNANGKNQLSDDENYDRCRGKLRFGLPNCEERIEPKNVEEDRENQTRRKPNAVPNKPFAMKGNLKSSGLQISRTKNVDDLKHLSLERLLEEDAQKEVEDRLANKPRKQPAVRQSCRLNDDVTSGTKKENREDDEEGDESLIKKNIYAGGDLELRVTKSNILGLIDRAISNEFGNLSDQQQSLDFNRGLTGQEIYVEIKRILQDNCYQSFPEDLLNHHELSADCIKLLKMLRWDHMTHIQKEFRKLCSLQKFLDTYSPRQSLPAFQSYPVAVEQQRLEERQQSQHEEKPNSGTIP